MSKYNNSKIYKIINDKTDKIYIGSTTVKYLCQRLRNHRSSFKYNKCSSVSQLLDLGDCQIILIENYSCNSHDELLARERFHIEQNKNICVNIRRPCISNDEKKNTIKEWQKNNKDKMKINNAKNRNKNNIVINCICGSLYGKYHKNEHEKTKKHLKYLELHSNS
jgi:hypothetical protein